MRKCKILGIDVGSRVGKLDYEVFSKRIDPRLRHLDFWIINGAGKNHLRKALLDQKRVLAIIEAGAPDVYARVMAHGFKTIRGFAMGCLLANEGLPVQIDVEKVSRKLRWNEFPSLTIRDVETCRRFINFSESAGLDAVPRDWRELRAGVAKKLSSFEGILAITDEVLTTEAYEAAKRRADLIKARLDGSSETPLSFSGYYSPEESVEIKLSLRMIKAAAPEYSAMSGHDVPMASKYPRYTHDVLAVAKAVGAKTVHIVEAFQFAMDRLSAVADALETTEFDDIIAAGAADYPQETRHGFTACLRALHHGKAVNMFADRYTVTAV